MDITQLKINGVYAGDFADAQSREDIAAIQASLTKLGQNYTGIRWKIADTVKVIEYVGDSDYKTRLMNWISNSPKPCEVKKDGTDFAYLLNTAGVASSTNWTQRANGAASHYNTADKEDYLQMVELENVNIAEIFDTENGYHYILFNLDKLCPAGFHRWFVEDTKLMGRYDICFAGEDSAATTISSCKGLKQTAGNFSFETIQSLVAATGAKILKYTGWEIAVIAWLQAFYYGSLNAETRGGQINSGSESAARAWVAGTTDSLTTPHGVAGGGHRFMYMENAIDGKQWLMGFGVRGMNGKGYFTRDDMKANRNALMDLADSDETFAYPTNLSGTYAKEVNILGVCIMTGGSASSGFFDGNWSNTNDDRILYVGGSSYIGSLCGLFARVLTDDVSYSYWDRRARCAMRKSAVVAA